MLKFSATAKNAQVWESDRKSKAARKQLGRLRADLKKAKNINEQVTALVALVEAQADIIASR